MLIDLLYPDDIDVRLNWPPGRARQLVRRGHLPHYLLPDGTVRLRWEEVAALAQHIQASPARGTPMVARKAVACAG